ncbi:GTP-binding protein [filamentous cyanobacterium LEGE 11480]|uniref:GTP-binding protein n=1 Tax=Romeriopsis navalis LEGE 11480 TaxID=2777977 RepID=A0A928Z438_9CYAN|nr:GTP-binding protein [Romeriopsis navalis]MBE9030632.1 GTP-binding protein [Romeriopsis navalis LEGE 11480]
MRIPRSITLILGVIVILVLMLWLTSSLLGLAQNLQGVSPILVNIVVALIIALLLLLLGAFVYYFVILPANAKKRQARRERPPVIPAEKTAAATENLKALRGQLDQIQDEVTRQALLNRSREIEQNLQLGGLTIAVFGTGSAGKSSLINALVGRMVGEVGATMGTTTVGATHKMQLEGVKRDILIADTPGILEAGDAGTEREKEARRLAAEADLLLFAIDGDLRQSEFKPLTDLIGIGKRSIIVLNKIDLLTEDDLNIILNSLRQKLQGYVNPQQDIIAVCANPQVVTLETGETVKPDPDIMPLIKHIAAVVRSEGDDLLADNILLQSQRLGDETRQLIDNQRRREAEKIVDRYQWIGAGVIAVTPLPIVDMLATAAVNAQMIVELGKVYGEEIDLSRGRELAMSLGKTLVSLGIVKGVLTLVTAFLEVSVVGLVLGRAIQGVSAAYLTRIAGKSFIEYFRQDQSWGDGGIAEVVQRQFELERKDEFMKAFIKDAIANVVKPLQMQAELVEPAETGIVPAEEPLPTPPEWAGQEIVRQPVDEIDEWQQ